MTEDKNKKLLALVGAVAAFGALPSNVGKVLGLLPRGTPALRPARMGQSRYGAAGPTLAGAAKCAKKGHRGRLTLGYCSRCRTWVEAAS